MVSNSLSNIFRWGMKGGLSILDQGIYSGANFISIILLARWQPPNEYGAFSVAFAVFLLLSGIYTGLILEPISILGPSRFAENKEEYFASQLRIHFLVTIPLSILFGLCGILLTSNLFRQTFLSASLALPFMLLTWLARRTYYSNHQPLGAFVCSLLYALTLMVGLWVISQSDNITVPMIFVIMSIAGIVGGLPLSWWEFQYRKNHGSPKISVLDVIHAHWDLGKWIVFAAIFSLAAEQIPIIFIANLRGLNDAGGFRAVQNFIQPIIQIEAALSLIGLPVLAREFGTNNIPNFRRMVLLLTTAMAGIAIIYGIGIWLTSDKLEQLAYGGQYAMYSHLIVLYSLVPIFLGLFTGFFIAIRATQQTKIYLINGIVSFIVGIPSSYFLIKSYGLAGAILGLIVTYLVVFILNLYLYFLWTPKVSLVEKSAYVDP